MTDWPISTSAYLVMGASIARSAAPTFLSQDSRNAGSDALLALVVVSGILLLWPILLLAALDGGETS